MRAVSDGLFTKTGSEAMKQNNLGRPGMRQIPTFPSLRTPSRQNRGFGPSRNLATVSVYEPRARQRNPAMMIENALKADHDRVRLLISKIQNDPASAPANYPQISDMLKRHSRAEEQTFYQALLDLGNAKITSRIATSEQQHQALGAMLKRLDGTDYAHPIWMSRFNQAVQALNGHLSVEEGTVFGYARALSPQRRAELGARYQQLMQGKSVV